MEILQDNKILVTKRTVDWLVGNTTVCVFDPLTFEGYQRQINEEHCLSIVSYVLKSFHLPDAIICACEDYNENRRLRIVDGQHRVEAFRQVMVNHKERYDEIKDFELPVVILCDVNQLVEIETFININKKSRKVDTSLAFVLKSKLSNPEDGSMAMPKSEYISVEVAQMFEKEESDDLWRNKISYEGNVKSTDKLISLNSFVKATRVLVNAMNQKGVVDLNWQKNEDVQHTTLFMYNALLFIWQEVYRKWPELNKGESLKDKRIIQGSIGYTAITRTLVKLLRENDVQDENSFYIFVTKTIASFGVSAEKWKGAYGSYSSGSGYKYISEELINSMRV